MARTREFVYQDPSQPRGRWQPVEHALNHQAPLLTPTLRPQCTQFSEGPQEASNGVDEDARETQNIPRPLASRTKLYGTFWPTKSLSVSTVVKAEESATP